MDQPESKEMLVRRVRKEVKATLETMDLLVKMANEERKELKEVLVNEVLLESKAAQEEMVMMVEQDQEAL